MRLPRPRSRRPVLIADRRTDRNRPYTEDQQQLLGYRRQEQAASVTSARGQASAMLAVSRWASQFRRPRRASYGAVDSVAAWVSSLASVRLLGQLAGGQARGEGAYRIAHGLRRPALWSAARTGRFTGL